MSCGKQGDAREFGIIDVFQRRLTTLVDGWDTVRVRVLVIRNTAIRALLRDFGHFQDEVVVEERKRLIT